MADLAIAFHIVNSSGSIHQLLISLVNMSLAPRVGCTIYRARIR